MTNLLKKILNVFEGPVPLGPLSDPVSELALGPRSPGLVGVIDPESESESSSSFFFLGFLFGCIILTFLSPHVPLLY